MIWIKSILPRLSELPQIATSIQPTESPNWPRNFRIVTSIERWSKKIIVHDFSWEYQNISSPTNAWYLDMDVYSEKAWIARTHKCEIQFLLKILLQTFFSNSRLFLMNIFPVQHGFQSNVSCLETSSWLPIAIWKTFSLWMIQLFAMFLKILMKVFFHKILINFSWKFVQSVMLVLWLR